MNPVKMCQAIAPILAIIVIGVLECFALSNGIDGIAFSGAVALIAGLGGYQAKKVKEALTHARIDGSNDNPKNQAIL